MAMFFDMTCFGGSYLRSTSPLSEFTPQSLFIPMLTVAVFGLYFFSRVWRFLQYGTVEPLGWHETQNTALKLYATFYVSQVALSLWPFQCYTNPGESEYLVVQFPSVLCTMESTTWAIMTSVGAASMLICMTFFAVLIFDVRRMPAMMSEPEKRELFVRARLFVFEDFRMEAYYWILPMKTREIGLGLLPTIIVDQNSLQVVLIAVFLLVAAVSTAWVQPFRIPLVNFLESSILILLNVGLMCATLSPHVLGQEYDSLNLLFTIVFILPPLMVIVVILGLLLALVRHGRRAELRPVFLFRRSGHHPTAIKEACKKLFTMEKPCMRRPSNTPATIFNATTSIGSKGFYLSSLRRQGSRETR